MEQVSWFKKYHIKYLLIIALLYGSKYLLYRIAVLVNNDYHTINMTIDSMIPFCKYFLIFYVTYYWFPEIQLWLMSYCDKRKFYRLLISISVCCLLCFGCFCVYQVKMVRPEVEGNDLFSVLMRVMYSLDKEAVNCFPSIHSLMGVAMIIGGYKTNKFPVWLSVMSCILGVGCILSTVFIKQHYFIDMVVGALLMIVVYLVVLLIDKKITKKRVIQ